MSGEQRDKINNELIADTKSMRVRAFLLASNLLAAFAVAVLLLIWIAGLEFNVIKEVTVDSGDRSATEKNSNLPSDEGEFDEPEVESLLSDDQLVTPVQLKGLLSLVKANESDLMNIGKRQGNNGREIGEHEDVGPIVDYIPESNRWRMKYVFNNRRTYIEQLDFLGIELAAADPDAPRIDYLKSVSTSTPVHRVSTRKEENRLGFRCADVRLQRWDIALMQEAGIKTQGKILIQYYPESLRAKLLGLEAENLNGRELKEVQQTRFEVRRSGDKYEIRVTGISFVE